MKKLVLDTVPALIQFFPIAGNLIEMDIQECMLSLLSDLRYQPSVYTLVNLPDDILSYLKTDEH